MGAPKPTYEDGRLSDSTWLWDPGSEHLPSAGAGYPPRGMGAFLNRKDCKASLVYKGKYVMWHRIELPTHQPLFVGLVYFPDAKLLADHSLANAELCESASPFLDQGHVILGGDFNAHTGANGDHRHDAAGQLLEESLAFLGLTMVNKIPQFCKDRFTRVEVKSTGVQSSTIDYVCCSPSLTPLIKSLKFGDAMNSDHKPLILSLKNIKPKPAQVPDAKLVWRTENIVSPPNFAWVNFCRAAFDTWTASTNNLIDALQAVGIENDRLADILDWSFQVQLDTVSNQFLGVKKVSLAKPPRVDPATDLANQQRETCEAILKQCMANPEASDEALQIARTNFLAARRAALKAGVRKRKLEELQLFMDIEKNQGKSKLFWGKVKQLRQRASADKAPLPIEEDTEGTIQTDPMEVLRVWKEFSATIASANLAGTVEEGIYDEDHRQRIDHELFILRQTRLTQEVLDSTIGDIEVFKALRAMSPGTCPGEEGILIDILRSAADAVNNSRLRGNNTVVSGLALLFNFVLANEVWPSRWQKGIIFPLYKKGNKLNPGNFRPIALLSVMGKVFGRIINQRLTNWSEYLQLFADEQGGFRPHRGCPDQILIFTEILQMRKEQGLPTFTTFIDVRKAYDTVWREQAFVHLHHMGINGKLWRQLQVMTSNLSRSIRLPSGTSTPFPLERGVAQGAVESPWLYASFINELAEVLHAGGFGVPVGDRRVPLLMYADDIVLLSRSARDLRNMHAVITEFARTHRFQINGDNGKSNIMFFNISQRRREALTQQQWFISGNPVSVTRSYVYLGVTITDKLGNWSPHLKKILADVTVRATRLIQLCRSHLGLRPRSAVTLWQSLVRPALEYASEVFGGTVSITVLQQIERVQAYFARAILGLPPSAPALFALAELGLERIQSRWAKLRLGYWRRVRIAPSSRLLSAITRLRAANIPPSDDDIPLQDGRNIASANIQNANIDRHYSLNSWRGKNWCIGVRHLLNSLGFPPHFWDNPNAFEKITAKSWKTIVEHKVDVAENALRDANLRALSSLDSYKDIKTWLPTPLLYATFPSEFQRGGARVCEAYLDDRTSFAANRLKTLCRANTLPLLDRIGRQLKWERYLRSCIGCGSHETESLVHFIFYCPCYERPRRTLFRRLQTILTRAEGLTWSNWKGMVYISEAPSWHIFESFDITTQLHIILGKRVGDPYVECHIDMATKRFLRQAWEIRRPVTVAINDNFGRKD